MRMVNLAPASSPRVSSASARQRRPLKRSDERGAALFVVVMVITLLAAIGIFSARAASMVDVASGYNRQSVQTQYIAEYGLRGVTARLARGEADAIVSEMANGIDDCRATANLAAALGGGQRPGCYKLFMSEVASAFDETLLEAPTETAPGSLGPPAPSTNQVAGNFVVELTEHTKAPGALPGFQVDGQNQSFQLVRITLTSQGEIRPFSASTTCDETSSRSAGNSFVRSHVVTLVGAHH